MVGIGWVLVSFSFDQAPARTTAPTSSGTRKVACQPKWASMMPPIAGPIAGATAIAMVMIAMALAARSRS